MGEVVLLNKVRQSEAIIHLKEINEVTRIVGNSSRCFLLLELQSSWTLGFEENISHNLIIIFSI